MGRILGQIHPAEGPSFSARVMASSQRVDWLKAHGMPYPTTVATVALIDTGASSTCIDISFVTALGLEPTGFTLVHTPSTRGQPVRRYIYDASVVFGEGTAHARTYTIDVIATELMDQGIRILIGRDILRRCVLTHDGPNARFELVF